MAAADLGFRVAEEALAEFIEENDPAVARPVQDDAVRMFHQLAILALALAEAILGAPAPGDVDADADQARSALELHASAGEEIRRGRAVLGDEPSLDERFPLVEHFRHPLGQQRLVLPREELERVHSSYLSSRISGDPLEVPVPAQEVSKGVVEVEDARHAVDHRVGEQPLAPRRLLRLEELTFVCKAVQCV